MCGLEISHMGPDESPMVPEQTPSVGTENRCYSGVPGLFSTFSHTKYFQLFDVLQKHFWLETTLVAIAA